MTRRITWLVATIATLVVTSTAAVTGASVATALQPSSVQIHVADTKIAYGMATKVTLHLEGGVTNHDVQLLAAPWDTIGWVVIGTKTVDANGDATFRVRPPVVTNYRGDYAGDASTASSSSDAPIVTVHSVVTGQLQGAFEVVREISRYHDADDVTFAVHVEPPQPSGDVHVTVQRKSFGTWMDVNGTDVFQSPSGDATAVFAASALAPGRYRVRAANIGTTALLAGHTARARFVIFA